VIFEREDEFLIDESGSVYWIIDRLDIYTLSSVDI
jgi:hypothetical protein